MTKCVRPGLCAQIQFKGPYFCSSKYLQLLSIWVLCAGVWGKLTPMKWAVFMKPYTESEACYSQRGPQISKYFALLYYHVQLSRVKLPQ